MIRGAFCYHKIMANQNSKRVNSAQLPSAVEFLDILKKESQRKAIRFDFIQVHNDVFGAHRQLSMLADSDDSWIDRYAQLSLDELVFQVEKNRAELTQYINEHPGDTELYESLYSSLVPDTTIGKSEAVFVFGASTNARIERAVELYKEDSTQKIIISGQGPYYKDTTESEAVRMAKFAQGNGVSPEAIILEEASITLPDNVKRTITIMEEINWRPSLLTIVATDFVLTRAMMEWYKFCPWEITIIPVAAHPQSERFTAKGWYKDPKTIALVLNEYVKMAVESKIELMRKEGEIA